MIFAPRYQKVDRRNPKKSHSNIDSWLSFNEFVDGTTIQQKIEKPSLFS